ncbi:MAG: HDOD domain-containing protein [Desulfobacterales bacterium]|jgi:HD-like signal output (HDOD) protein
MAGKQQIVDTVKTRIERLPLIDAAVFRTLSMLEDPNIDFERFAEALSPTIALRLLDMAAELGTGPGMRSIHNAVKTLGYEKMKQVLISSILLDHFTRQPDYENFDFDRFSKQAHLCAAIAGALGEIVDFPEREDLFTASMLHNIGKMAVAIYFPAQLEQIVALKKTEALPTKEAERRVLGADHATLGSIILERFRLPSDICEAVRLHDADKLPSDSSELAALLHSACRITGRFSLPGSEDAVGAAGLLGEAVENGRMLYLKKFGQGRSTPKYTTRLADFLTIAADLVEMDLKKFLDIRAAAPSGS